MQYPKSGLRPQEEFNPKDYEPFRGYYGRLSEDKMDETAKYFHSLVFQKRDFTSARRLYQWLHDETKMHIRANKKCSLALKALQFKGV